MVGESSELPQNKDIKLSLPGDDITTLKVELQQLRTINLQNHPDQILKTITNIENGSATNLLKTIVDRLKKEPECPSVALDKAVAVATGQPITDIRFDSRSNPGEGEYMRHIGKISLSKDYKKKTPKIIISEIMLCGFDELTTVIRHERIHADQALPTTFHEIVASLKRQFHKSDEQDQDFFRHLLGGIQAYTVADNLDEDRIVQHLTSIPDYRSWLNITTGRVSPPAEDLDLIRKGAQAVNRLYALGFTDKQVAELVRRARWDKSKKGFNLLEGRINVVIESQGINKDELDQLVEISKLKRELYLEKAKKIAREEALKVFKE